MYHINLQLFAQAGDLVTGSTQYVNAYTGHGTPFSPPNTMDGEMKVWYDTQMLENARVDMYYAQFAKKQNLPARHGRTVEWRKWNTFGRAEKLTEGVIPTGQKFGMSTLTAKIDQYGTYTAVTDILEMHGYDDVIGGATVEMGASMAETQEALIRDALLVGKNVLYCDNITLADGTISGKTPTSCVEMHASSTVLAKFTRDTANRARTIMKQNHVPTINGKYYAVINPSVTYDLRSCEGWWDAHKYARPDEIFNGEIGELDNIRFIEDAFAPILDGDYVNAEGTVTYATYVFGRDSFGIIDPEGGGSEVIAKPKEVVGGPLNQFSTVGYKFETNGATILYPTRLLRIMSCSSYSATDEPN